MAADFWNGRRVFVTGHTGFKGGWFTLWLRKLEAVVAGYSLAPLAKPNLFEVAKVSDGIHNVIADINDFERLKAEMRRFEPEVVFHLAAQPLVRYSYDNPLETLQTNIMGTANVLEAVRQAPTVRAVVIITTDKCYENKDWEWGYRETDALGGYDPYSSSKAAAEIVTASYRNSFFPLDRYDEHQVAVATARAGNVIGGGDWSPDRLIPDLLRSFEAGRPIVLRNPGSVRPWQHVLEPLNGYLQLAQKLVETGPPFADSWNFGPSETDSISVLEIVKKMNNKFRTPVEVETGSSPQPHEAKVLRLDTSRARVNLGWRPVLTIDSAITWVVDWALSHQRGQDMRAATGQQIESYQALLEGRAI